jgi:hypothetical protein
MPIGLLEDVYNLRYPKREFKGLFSYVGTHNSNVVILCYPTAIRSHIGQEAPLHQTYHKSRRFIRTRKHAHARVTFRKKISDNLYVQVRTFDFPRLRATDDHF